MQKGFRALQCIAAEPSAAHRLGGIQPANPDYRHLKVGSDLEGVRVPPPSG